MQKELVISVMSRDKVGIVAEVTDVINRLGGNLEDVSQTVMRGYFNMILLAAFPDRVTADALRQALESSPGLDGAVFGFHDYKPVDGADDGPDGESSLYVLTAVGQDRPGQVAAISRYLSGHGVNIVDLATRINQGDYTMVFLISLPQEVDIADLRRDLQDEVNGLGLKIELRHRDIFLRTNEI